MGLSLSYFAFHFFAFSRPSDRDTITISALEEPASSIGKKHCNKGRSKPDAVRRPRPVCFPTVVFKIFCWNWPNHDNLRRLTDASKSSWHPARILTCCHIYSFVFALCMKCQASYCSICFQKPGFSSLDQPSTSSSRTHKAVLTRQNINDLLSLIVVGKLMALFFHDIASLAMADCAYARLVYYWR